MEAAQIRADETRAADAIRLVVPKDPPLPEIKAALRRAGAVCTVYAPVHSEHVLQIYAGLYALHESGDIRVRQRFAAADLQRRLADTGIDYTTFGESLHGLLVDLEGAGLVFFDVRDGGNYRGDIMDAVAVYAKRAFLPSPHPEHRKKLIPLGLNYSVYHDRTTALELVKSIRQSALSPLGPKQLAISLLRIFPSIGRSLGVPTVGALTEPVEAKQPVRAIFAARTWVPTEVPPLPPQAVVKMNDFRANCIRELREHLGARVTAGFAHSEHARECYPDCLLDPQFSSRRRDYLRNLRAYSVCVSTAGLWDSTGWKFAEYVALGRAIVSEPIRFGLPGPMSPGENYLEFTTPAQCASRVAELLDDDAARQSMMQKNARYFAEYGTPQAVVARALHAALR
jgi:hypothetical protein